MSTHDPTLADLIGIGTLQTFQDSIANITLSPTVICDLEGRPVIGPAGPTAILDLFQNTPAARDMIRDVLKTVVDTGTQTALPLSFDRAAIAFDHRTVGTLIIGGRPDAPLNADQSARIRVALGLSSGIDPGAILRAQSRTERERRSGLLEQMAGMLSEVARKAWQLRVVEDELGTVHDFVKLLSGKQDPQEVLDFVARRVCDVLNIDASSIRLLDEQRGELIIRAVHNLSPAYLDKGAILVDENPIDRAALSGEAVYVQDARTDSRIRFPAQAKSEGIVSGLSVGMTYRGQTIGIMRVYARRVHHFSAAEIALLRSVASQAAAVIVHNRLLMEAVQAERYHHQLEYAGNIQRRMIPRTPPQHPGLQVATVYEPSSQVGGDFFDFYGFRDSDELGVCIADVVGKGVPAALLMAALRTAFRLYAYSAGDAAEAVTLTNIHMQRETLASEFATAFYGVFENNGRRLLFCNAGHDPPLLWRNGDITPLMNDGFIIGVNPQARYTSREITLLEGDALLLYTDGMFDAVNFGDESYGRTQLQDSFARHAHLSAEGIAKNVIWDVRRFVGLADQADDMTLVAIKVI